MHFAPWLCLLLAHSSAEACLLSALSSDLSTFPPTFTLKPIALREVMLDDPLHLGIDLNIFTLKRLGAFEGEHSEAEVFLEALEVDGAL